MRLEGHAGADDAKADSCHCQGRRQALQGFKGLLQALPGKRNA
jgi:hypothetical protein